MNDTIMFYKVISSYISEIKYNEHKVFVVLLPSGAKHYYSTYMDACLAIMSECGINTKENTKCR
jgi:hypothetical protein